MGQIVELSQSINGHVKGRILRKPEISMPVIENLVGYALSNRQEIRLLTPYRALAIESRLQRDGIAAKRAHSSGNSIVVGAYLSYKWIADQLGRDIHAVFFIDLEKLVSSLREILEAARWFLGVPIAANRVVGHYIDVGNFFHLVVLAGKAGALHAGTLHVFCGP